MATQSSLEPVVPELPMIDLLPKDILRWTKDPDIWCGPVFGEAGQSNGCDSYLVFASTPQTIPTINAGRHLLRFGAEFAYALGLRSIWLMLVHLYSQTVPFLATSP